MTQDSVISVTASEGRAVEVLQPNIESFALLNDIYRFVYEDKNRPARYYDLPTQAEISELCGGIDIDILHMTEAMRLQLVDLQEESVDSTEEIAATEAAITMETPESVVVDMKLDVKYYPGQLVVVVLGIPGKNLNYTWYPYRAEVPETGLIRYTCLNNPKHVFEEATPVLKEAYDPNLDRVPKTGCVVVEWLYALIGA